MRADEEALSPLSQMSSARSDKLWERPTLNVGIVQSLHRSVFSLTTTTSVETQHFTSGRLLHQQLGQKVHKDIGARLYYIDTIISGAGRQIDVCSEDHVIVTCNSTRVLES